MTLESPDPSGTTHEANFVCNSRPWDRDFIAVTPWVAIRYRDLVGPRAAPRTLPTRYRKSPLFRSPPHNPRAPTRRRHVGVRPTTGSEVGNVTPRGSPPIASSAPAESSPGSGLATPTTRPLGARRGHQYLIWSATPVG